MNPIQRNQPPSYVSTMAEEPPPQPPSYESTMAEEPPPQPPSYESAMAEEPPPSYETVMAEDAARNARTVQTAQNVQTVQTARTVQTAQNTQLGDHRIESVSTGAAVNLNYQMCKAIMDRNYDEASRIISQRIERGERFRIYSDTVEARALQGDWDTARSLARHRLNDGFY